MIPSERAERVDHLLEALAEPDHQARLGDHILAAHLLRVPQHPARALEPGAAPRKRIEPRDHLDVVIEDIGALGDHVRQRHLLAAEVRRQHLDLAAMRLSADLPDHADKRRCTVIREVIAVDAGDHRVAEPHPRDAPRDARGLERIVPGRLTGLDVAEPAPPRAGVAEDHERRGAALPALADVRARRLLADRVQVL